MLIAHRINRLEDLKALASDTAVEFDVRESDYQLTVRHDAFTPGESFISFLPYLKTRFCIVNVKCEGVELYILKLFAMHGIENFFFLDCSIPMIHKLVCLGESRIAVRWSQYESIQSVIEWAGKIQWVWVDCFTMYPLTKLSVERLTQFGFKLCIVSPELQGRDADIEPTRNLLATEEIQPDAICTKIYNFPRWSKLYSSDELPSQKTEES